MDKRKIPNTIYGMSPPGWIDHELFANWFLKLFIKNIPQTRPVLLLLYRHSSHYTLEGIKIAAENDIVLFVCHQIQLTRLDHLMSAFRTSENTLVKYIPYRYMSENPGKVVTKFQFSSLLHEAWFHPVQPETIRSVFQKIGIYPFDAKAIKPITSSQVTALEEYSSSDTAT